MAVEAGDVEQGEPASVEEVPLEEAGDVEAGDDDELRHPQLVLTSLVSLYTIVFTFLTVRQHRRYGTSAFDLGIYDQGIWLLSRFDDPFVTVRGLDFFGNHLNLTTYLLVPIYWLGGGVDALLLVQTVAMAAGAIPLWHYACDRLGNAWWALAPAAAYLLFPALAWMNAWHFHPEKLAIAPMIAAFLFAGRRQWRAYAACVAFVLLTREDFALTVAVLGIVLAAFRGERRVGLATFGAAAIWFVVATQVLMPWRNEGEGGFYSGYFARLGDTPTEIVFNAVVHPSRVLDRADDPQRLTYYRQMTAPTAGLPVLAPTTLAVAAPSVFINTMAEGVDAANIRYQYSTMTTAVLFVGTVDGLVLLRRRRTAFVRFGLGALLATSLASNVAWAPSPIGILAHRATWIGENPRGPVMAEALAVVPSGDGVSSTYNFVPHLTHRRTSYLFPNPWDVQNWGFRDEPTGRPDRVEWLVVDRTLLGESRDIYDQLVGPGDEFEVVFEEEDVVVARRVRPPESMEPLR